MSRVLLLAAVLQRVAATMFALQGIHHSPQTYEESLETLLIGQSSHCLWTRASATTDTDNSQWDSGILIHNRTGFAESYFTYQANLSSPPSETPIANLLILRFYQLPYINTHYTQLRLPLLNYSDNVWRGLSFANITYQSSSTGTATSIKQVGFQVSITQVVLKFGSSETITLVQDTET